MPDPSVLVPVPSLAGSTHFFDADALKAIVQKATTDLPNGHKNVVAGTVDSTGANVALVMSSADGAWKVQTAFAHDWQGNNTFGASGSYSW